MLCKIRLRKNCKIQILGFYYNTISMNVNNLKENIKPEGCHGIIQQNLCIKYIQCIFE